MQNSTALPVIILPGIGQSRVLTSGGTGGQPRRAWPPDIPADAAETLKGPLMKSLLFRRDMGLSEKTAALVRQILEPMATMPDGTMKHPLRTVTYPNALAACTEDQRNFINRMVPCDRLADRIGADRIYFFAYNPLDGPYEVAAALDGMIQNVKKTHGCARVNLLPVSLGGAMATAYFDAYGDKNDIHRVMYFVAALDGSALAADVLEGNINASDPSGLVAMLASRKAAATIQRASAMMPKGLPEKMTARAIDALVETAAGNSPAIWSIVPSQRYPALREKLLRAPEKAALLEKTDRFNRAQLRFPETVRRLRENGAEFFACAGYGLPLMALSRSDRLSSDGVVNLTSAALGARVAPLGETLPADAAGPYVSPDRTVDASGALFRDTTWFFAGEDHEGIAENAAALEIAARVLSDDSFKNTDSDPAFPRFGKAASPAAQDA